MALRTGVHTADISDEVGDLSHESKSGSCTDDLESRFSSIPVCLGVVQSRLVSSGLLAFSSSPRSLNETRFPVLTFTLGDDPAIADSFASSAVCECRPVRARFSLSVGKTDIGETDGLTGSLCLTDGLPGSLCLTDGLPGSLCLTDGLPGSLCLQLVPPAIICEPIFTAFA